MRFFNKVTAASLRFQAGVNEKDLDQVVNDKHIFTKTITCRLFTLDFYA